MVFLRPKLFLSVRKKHIGFAVRHHDHAPVVAAVIVTITRVH